MVQSVSAEDRSGKATFGMRVGEDTVEAYADLLHPVLEFNNSAVIFNPRFSYKDEGEHELNVGLVFRHLLENKSVILGANIYADSRESRHGNRFNQLGLGLEFLSKWFDARINWYDADSTPELINEFTETQIDTTVSRFVSRQTTTEQFFDDPFARINRILQNRTTNTSTVTTFRTTTTTVQTDRIFQEFETGLDGYDAEVGVKLPFFGSSTDVRLFVGKYDFDGGFGQQGAEGYKGRLEVRSGPYLTFDAEVFEDAALNGTDYFVGARLHIPLYGKDTWRRFRESYKSPSLNSFEDRMYSDMVMRDVRVQMDESDPIEDLGRFKQKTDVDVDVQRSRTTNNVTETLTVRNNVTFVDGDNEGGAVEDGTAENPWGTLQEGSDNAIGATIFVHEVSSGGGNYTDGVTLQSNQELTSTITAMGGKKFETTNRPVVEPGSGDIGVDIAGTSNTVINRLEINTDDADGISTIAGAGGTGSFTVVNNVISTTDDDAYGVFFEADADANIVISNNTISTDGFESFGIGIENEPLGPGQPGSIVITNNMVVTTGDEASGIELISDSFSTIVSGNNVSTSGDDFAFGIFIENNSDESASITGNTIATFGDNGSHGAIIDSNGNGTAVISNNTITTDDDFGIGIVSDNEDGTGQATVNNNTVMTDGDDSDGVLLIGGAGSTSAANNNVTTMDEDSFGIAVLIEDDGMVSVTNNTVLTLDEDSIGIFATTIDGGDDGAVTIQSNNITTQGDFADGVETILDEAGDAIISNNNIDVSGDAAEGVDTDNDGTGDTTISNNVIVTRGDDIGGDDADGVDSDNDSLGTTFISGNTITTTGTSAEGISSENDLLVAGPAIITGNRIVTTNANGVDTDDSCSQITGNIIDAGGGTNAIDATSSLLLANVALGAEVASLQAGNTITNGGVVATGGTALGVGAACP